MEKGIEKGILEGKKKAAKNFLKLGLTVKQVAEARSYLLKVEQLKKEIKN